MNKYYERNNGYGYEILVASSPLSVNFCERKYDRVSHRHAMRNIDSLWFGCQAIGAKFNETAKENKARLLCTAGMAVERLAIADEVSRERYEN